MSATLQLGRYSLYAQLASGGMATVYLGRLNGEVGFGRTVAIKRLHPHMAREPEFVTMFLDEAHLAARVRHPNVVPTLDIVTSEDELFLVMEYIQGESLGALLRIVSEGEATIPVPIAVAISIGLLSGLHAAHEATDEAGRPLGIIHRDVSPQNVLVGADGVARLVDFGVAKAATRLVVTQEGQIKGKVPYMAPEQLSGVVSRESDIYAAGVVLWESLAMRRLFRGDTEGELVSKVAAAEVKAPSRYNQEVSPELDAIVLHALARAPEDRWTTALAMAEALDRAVRPASAMRVSEWVSRVAAVSLQKKAALVAVAETASEPRGGDPLIVSGSTLPALEPARDILSDPNTSVPALPRNLDSQSIAGSLTRDSTRAVPAVWAWTSGLVVLAALSLGGAALALVRQRPEPASVAGASAPVAAAVPTTAATPWATVTAVPAPHPAVVASAPASSASVAPRSPSSAPPPRKSDHAAHHPSSASSDYQDLLDTR